jgi:hypothetical protein
MYDSLYLIINNLAAVKRMTNPGGYQHQSHVVATGIYMLHQM